MEDRRTLGYHQDGNRVPLTYSRDGAARPLAILESLVAEIASGAFKPDSTCSGRLREVQSSNTVNVIKIEDEDDGQSDKSLPEELSDGHTLLHQAVRMTLESAYWAQPLQLKVPLRGTLSPPLSPPLRSDPLRYPLKVPLKVPFKVF